MTTTLDHGTFLEIMGGEDYKSSYYGKLYHAYEKILPVISKGKFGDLASFILRVIPHEVRERINYKMQNNNNLTEPWKPIPDINPNILIQVQSTIMVTGGKCSVDLVRLLDEDYKHFFWASYDCFKLLEMMHGISRKWYH